MMRVCKAQVPPLTSCIDGPGHRSHSSRITGQSEVIHIDGEWATRRNIPGGHEIARSKPSSLLPLPPLRPERAAYGVADLRSGSSHGNTTRALMTGMSASGPQLKTIPLNI
jgi:hypothetical protein